MNVIVSIDAGGTTTEFVVYHEGHIIAKFSGTGSNLSNNREQAIDTVMNGLQEVLDETWQVKHVVIGMAGVVGNPLVEVLKDRIEDFYKTAVAIYNDVVFAHKAIFKNQPGLLLSAGTGSIAIIHDGQTVNYEIIGGYGHLFGDEGSGYDIARRAVRYCMEMHDLKEADTFTAAILKYLQVDTIREAIPYLYRAEKGDVAALAKVVNKLALADNAVAIELLTTSATSYVTYIIAILEKRKLQITEYALWGSVFVKNVLMQKVVTEAIESALNMKRVETEKIDISQAALFESK